jgi:type IV secretory pathway VirB10-like protein
VSDVGPDREEEDRVEAPPAPPLAEPGEMRLRPERPRVTRLSPKVLAGLGGASAVAVAGALLWGLHGHKGPGSPQQLYNTDNKPPADQMASLPEDYAGLPHTSPGASTPAGAPQLGPKLPGDLGRPMLNAGVTAPGIGEATSTPAASPADERREQTHQRLAQEVDTARTSSLFTSEASAASVPAATALAGAALPVSTAQPSSEATAAAQKPSEGDRKLAFLNGAADRTAAASNRVQAPESPNVVQAGAVISAALITGLRSDLPGQVTAQVTEPVYDSPTGKVLLIPQGARLIGQYDAQVSFGQSRALLVWTRLIFPDGRSIVLGRQPGADPQGFAGLEDQVDNHWGQLFKAAMLSTLLSVGSEVGTSDNENSLFQALREGASNAFAQTGQQVVSRSLSVQPTITVRPGFAVRVIVTRDLVLDPYSG